MVGRFENQRGAIGSRRDEPGGAREGKGRNTGRNQSDDIQLTTVNGLHMKVNEFLNAAGKAI